MIRRRDFLTYMGIGTAMAAVPLAAARCSGGAEAPPPGKNEVPPNGLREPAFRPLALTSIRPEGWLRRQLRIQADGLTGHLDTFWPDVARSRWFGGDADGWERAPYWMDGAIPRRASVFSRRSRNGRIRQGPETPRLAASSRSGLASR